MVGTCYNDSVPAGANNFLKLVSKYGYCQEKHDLFDPCHDLYMMMCFASFQVALGSVQIFKAITGRIKGRSKVGDTTEINTSGPEFCMNLACDIGLSLLGTLRLVPIRFSDFIFESFQLHLFEISSSHRVYISIFHRST